MIMEAFFLLEVLHAMRDHFFQDLMEPPRGSFSRGQIASWVAR
jgi:hypothetical protein